MRYQFRFRNTAGNLLAMAMYSTYTSFMGVINLVFTLAMLALSLHALESGWRAVLPFSAAAMLYFPLLQPLIIYFRMKKNLRVNEELNFSFTDSRIYISQGEQHQEYGWEQILSAEKKPFQVALYLHPRHGFVIPNHAMGEKKEEFYRFALERIGKGKKSAV